jgi:hypothetical protein
MSEPLEQYFDRHRIPAVVRERERDRFAKALAGELGIALEPYFERFNQPLVEPVAGRVGWQELIRGENPAAAQSFEYTVPGQEVVKPLSVMCRLTTSAVVGYRTVTIEYRDADDVRYLVAGAPVGLEESQVQSFCWYPQAGAPAWPVDDCALAPFPPQFLYPTCTLAIKLGGAQAGDQLDQVRISAEKFRT